MSFHETEIPSLIEVGAFKKWLAVDLVGGERNEILIPAGCAHGYLTLDDSIVSYKC